MFRKLFCVIMTVVLTLGCVGVVALADNDKVEISFCVGDETLMINGQAVVVEKPYVVGDGVTLVPLRVIAEAFGAEVLWGGERQNKFPIFRSFQPHTLTLNYPDVNIVLEIANPTAEINGRTEVMLAAPELTSSGYTMVPLRFISETFGATVSYDETTQRITVIKEVEAKAATVLKVNKCTVEIPADYKAVPSFLAVHSYGKDGVVFGVDTSTTTIYHENEDISKLVESYGEYWVIDGKINENIQYVTLGDKEYMLITTKIEGSSEDCYIEKYFVLHAFNGYIFTAGYIGNSYTESMQKEIRNIIASVEYDE